MKCWHCGAELEPPVQNKLGFRATCDKCHAYLHCCKNCNFYQVGKPNDCLIPGTERIADRTAGNYCDEFSLKGEGPPPTMSKKDIASLFGDDNAPPEQDPKDRWRTLFDDKE